METQDKQSIKRKAFAISVIMKNPKLAQSIWDSWDSPVGSTKNNKARSILYSMNKTNNVQDGMGGGFSDWWQSNIVSPLEGMGTGIRSRLEDTSSRLQNPPGAQQLAEEGDAGITKVVKGVDDLIGWSQSPTRTQGISKAHQDVIDTGKGVWNLPTMTGDIVTGAGKTIYPWTKVPWELERLALDEFFSSLGAYLDPERRGEDAYKERMGIKSEYDFPWDKEGVSKEPDKAIGTDPSKMYYRVTGQDKVRNKITDDHITEAQAKEIAGFWDQVEEVSAGKVLPPAEEKFQTQRKTSQEDSNEKYKEFLMAGKDPKSAEYEAKWATGFNPNVDLVNKELKQDPSTNPSFGYNDISNMTPEEAAEWYNNLDNSEKDFWKESYDATTGDIFSEAVIASNQGIGPGTFAYIYLRDKEKLGKALGLSKEQAAALPEGLLSEQLNALRDSIRKDHRLEEQLDNLLKLQQRDLTINEDFESYIRGKDEYLGDIDELLDGAATKIAHMDTSNPYVAQRMEMYVNYLTILQGRQNKRYIDFLDSGITHHKNQIDSAINIYDRSIAQANKEYSELDPVTTETFNMMKTMLEEIYNNVEAREDRQIKLEEYERWKIDAVGRSLNIVLQNDKLRAEITGGTGNVEVNSSMDKMFTNMYRTDDNDDGTLNFTTYNPYEVINQANLAGHTGDYALNSFMKDMGYTVNKSVGGGSLSQFEIFKKSMGDNVASGIVDINNLNKEEQKVYDSLKEEEKEAFEAANNLNLMNFYTMRSKLENNVRAGMATYFGATEERILELRKAITELSNLEGFGKYTKYPYGYSKEKFVDEYKDSFGEFTEKMYDFTAWGVSEGKSDQEKEGKKGVFTSADFWADDVDKSGMDLVNEFTKVFSYYLMY